MIVTKKNVTTLLKGVLAAMPAIPYIARSRRSTPILAYVVGGVGLALAGGIAAVMFMSPRTRTRALTAAKDTYGKVNEKISHIRHPEMAAELDGSAELNGIADRGEYSTSTGL